MKSTIFICVVIGLAIACWVGELYIIDHKQKDKESSFIDNCTKVHGVVGMVGTWYTNNYLVCNNYFYSSIFTSISSNR